MEFVVPTALPQVVWVVVDLPLFIDLLKQPPDKGGIFFYNLKPNHNYYE